MAFHRILVWHCLVAVGPWFDPCHGSHSGKMDAPKAYPKWWTWILVDTTQFYFDIFGNNTKETKQPHPSYSIIFDHICILSLFIPFANVLFHHVSSAQLLRASARSVYGGTIFFFGCWLGTVSTRSTRCEYKLVRRFVVYRCLVIERPPVLAKVWICLGIMDRCDQAGLILTWSILILRVIKRIRQHAIGIRFWLKSSRIYQNEKSILRFKQYLNLLFHFDEFWFHFFYFLKVTSSLPSGKTLEDQELQEVPFLDSDRWTSEVGFGSWNPVNSPVEVGSLFIPPKTNMEPENIWKW